MKSLPVTWNLTNTFWCTRRRKAFDFTYQKTKARLWSLNISSMGKGHVWINSQRVRKYLNIYIHTLLDLITKNAVGQQNSLVTYQTITLVQSANPCPNILKQIIGRTFICPYTYYNYHYQYIMQQIKYIQTKSRNQTLQKELQKPKK